MRRGLDPKLDVVFKMLFADEHNQRSLIALLTAILKPSSPIVEVTVLNPEIPKAVVVEHGAVLDVRTRLQDGRQACVEMQTAGHVGLRGRALYYWARGYVSQLPRGAKYGELRPAVNVFILNFEELAGRRFHSVFRVLEVDDQTLFSQDLELHVLELPKIPQALSDAAESTVVLWGRFFAARTDEELEQVAMRHPDLQQAKTALDELSADPAARELAEERELALWNYERSIRLARGDGRAEGRAEGKAEGRAEGKAEGRAEGKANTLHKQLVLRFGDVGSEVAARISAGSEAELDQWLERVLLATSVGKVFDG